MAFIAQSQMIFTCQARYILVFVLPFSDFSTRWCVYWCLALIIAASNKRASSGPFCAYNPAMTSIIFLLVPWHICPRLVRLADWLTTRLNIYSVRMQLVCAQTACAFTHSSPFYSSISWWVLHLMSGYSPSRLYCDWHLTMGTKCIPPFSAAVAKKGRRRTALASESQKARFKIERSEFTLSHSIIQRRWNVGMSFCQQAAAKNSNRLSGVSTKANHFTQ